MWRRWIHRWIHVLSHIATTFFHIFFVVTSHHFVEPLVLFVSDFGWLCPWVSKLSLVRNDPLWIPRSRPVNGPISHKSQCIRSVVPQLKTTLTSQPSWPPMYLPWDYIDLSTWPTANVPHSGNGLERHLVLKDCLSQLVTSSNSQL